MLYSCLMGYLFSPKVKELKKRMDVLEKTEQKLAIIEDFNKRLNVFDASVSEVGKSDQYFIYVGLLNLPNVSRG